jgi:hypothetical protein
MNGKINGVIKQWWPLLVAGIVVAIGWGTLQAEVAHNREAITTLKESVERVRGSIGRIEQGIARIEGALQNEGENP